MTKQIFPGEKYPLGAKQIEEIRQSHESASFKGTKPTSSAAQKRRKANNRSNQSSIERNKSATVEAVDEATIPPRKTEDVMESPSADVQCQEATSEEKRRASRIELSENEGQKLMRLLDDALVAPLEETTIENDQTDDENEDQQHSVRMIEESQQENINKVVQD